MKALNNRAYEFQFKNGLYALSLLGITYESAFVFTSQTSL